MSGAHAAPSRIQLLATTVRWPGIGRSIARTAGFNAASTAAAGLGGIILARAVGPTVRGEYAAITAWFGVALMIGGMGQPAALCFYVARDPLRAREYVATSRAMMLTTGTIVPDRRDPAGPSSGARHRCGLARLPDCVRHFDRGIRRGELYLLTAGTRPAPVERSEGQPARAQRHCHWCAVAAEVADPGQCAGSSFRHHGAAAWLGLRELPARQPRPWPCACQLIRPLAVYGAAQIAALTPATLNAQLDQLVLSQTVSAADLGRYAIAVSLTLAPASFCVGNWQRGFPAPGSARPSYGRNSPHAAHGGAGKRGPCHSDARAASGRGVLGSPSRLMASATGGPCRCCGS